MRMRELIVIIFETNMAKIFLVKILRVSRKRNYVYKKVNVIEVPNKVTHHSEQKLIFGICKVINEITLSGLHARLLINFFGIHRAYKVI